MVDYRFDGSRERLLELRLVHIVLVLPYSNGLGVNLDQLCQRVHEAASDTDGSANSHILIGELFARNGRGGIDGSAVFANDKHVNLVLQTDVLQHIAHKSLRFTRSGAVAYSNGLNLKLFDEADDDTHGSGFVGTRRRGINDVMSEEVSLCGEGHHLASGSVPGVDGEDALLAKRGCQEQLASVVGEDVNGFGVGFLLGCSRIFGFDGRLEQTFVTILNGECHLVGSGAVILDEDAV